MKKFITILTALLLSVAFAFSLTGCNMFMFETDEKQALKNLEKLIDRLSDGDREGIKSLFAPNKISDIMNFDESIEELLSYYEGDFISHTNSGPMTDTDVHKGVTVKYYEMSNQVATSKETYSFAIRWFVRDDSDSGNVGIWSLYVIKDNDDPDKDLYSYWGDGTWTNGIHIGFPHVSTYFENLWNCIQNEDQTGIKALFAPNIVNGITDFDDSVNLLIDYCGGITCKHGWDWDAELIEKKENGSLIRYYEIAYGINNFSDEDDMDYWMCARWRTEDETDASNVGLWSLYVISCKDIDVYATYWGDGLWTNGINIGIPYVNLSNDI